MNGRQRRALVLAHRGGDVGQPNSLEAIRSAAARGADGVEIDIQLTDGRLIARHDLGTIADEESHDTFDDVLRLATELGLFLLIDFKSSGEAAVGAEAEALAAALPPAGSTQRLAVSAFSLPFLARFAELRPDVERHAIISLRQNFWGRSALAAGSGVSVLAAALLVKPQLVRQATRNGGRLLVWFGATEWPFVIRLAARVGADGLIVHRLGAVAGRLR